MKNQYSIIETVIRETYLSAERTYHPRQDERPVLSEVFRVGRFFMISQHFSSVRYSFN